MNIRMIKILRYIFAAYISLGLPGVQAFCWKPNINPFTGTPVTQRLDAATVTVKWEHIFPRGRHCQYVDFLIKSHPLKDPSDYKLSDLTLKGKRTATLNIPEGDSYTFIVIAREDKGPGIGIEYAYSRPVASVYTPRKQKSVLLAVDDPGNGSPEYEKPKETPITLQTSRPTTTTTTTKRTFIRPQVKSLEIPRRFVSNADYYEEYVESKDELQDFGGGAAPWYVYECVPLLKNIAGFETGTKKNNILTKFIQHMNQNSVSTVKSFVSNNKSCKSGYEGPEAGHLVTGDAGDQKCCSTPWGDAGCYQQFARCDGACIPHDWVADGWPDCMDGADEANLTIDGKVFPFQLGCVHCAGVILSSAFLCLESPSGLSRDCIEEVLGPGQCNVCIEEYLTLQ